MAGNSRLLRILAGASAGFGRGFAQGAEIGVRQKKYKIDNSQRKDQLKLDGEQLSFKKNQLSESIRKFTSNFEEKKRAKELTDERNRVNRSLELLSRISKGELNADIATQMVGQHPTVFTPDFVSHISDSNPVKKQRLLGIVNTILGAADIRDRNGDFDLEKIRSFFREVASIESRAGLPAGLLKSVARKDIANQYQLEKKFGPAGAPKNMSDIEARKEIVWAQQKKAGIETGRIHFKSGQEKSKALQVLDDQIKSIENKYLLDGDFQNMPGAFKWGSR